MHGLINRAIQCFIQDTYGTDQWVEIARDAGLDFVEFESMLTYDDELTERVLNVASRALGRDRVEVMEDIGTYLVSNKNVEALRRLLRFGGTTFVEFLYSLDELQDRARLAVDDLELPRIELWETPEQAFLLRCDRWIDGFGHVLVGLLRTMADDYGALVWLDYGGFDGDQECITIQLIEDAHGPGREFQLGAIA